MSKTKKEKQPNSTKNLDKIVFEGRMVEDGLELVYQELKKLSDSIRDSLTNGDNLLSVVMNAVGHIDHIKFFCTVPVFRMQQSLIDAYMDDVNEDVKKMRETEAREEQTDEQADAYVIGDNNLD